MTRAALAAMTDITITLSKSDALILLDLMHKLSQDGEVMTWTSREEGAVAELYRLLAREVG